MRSTRLSSFRAIAACFLLLGVCGLLSAVAEAETTPQQSTYWWQDEIRTTCLALARARTGRPAQWPQMTVEAGNAVLPLPRAAGPIQADGRLDEPAWKQATSFPVGPIFGDWQRGPFLLQVSVCRDAKNVYLAIQSESDLTDLGSVPGGGLFTIGEKTYRLGDGGGLPPRSVRRNGTGQTIELALPIQGELTMSFAVEALRAGNPAVPAALGLDKHKGPVWLRPVSVRLVPCETTVQLHCVARSRREPGLDWRVIEPGKQATEGTIPLKPADAGLFSGQVVPYSWKTTAEGRTFSAEGFFFCSALSEQILAARSIAARLKPQAAGAEADLQQLAAIEAEAKNTSTDDQNTWRALYCRARELRARLHLKLLDAPLMFVKQHPYFAAHIYDDFYPWHPGGGIYVLEEPSRPQARPKVRAVIDPATNETLGEGVYRDPDLFWDATRLVFAHKQTPNGVTSLYEIGIDGHGLRRITSSDTHSDYNPAYLPDGRIVFLSTRPRALVPCFNSGVGTLHTIHPDGSGLTSISVNNVNEFDPSVLPDGRILYGRWEYVDKTALYMQSLWTTTPDGRMEEALFKNNLPRPTACLDARAVPGSHQVVASLTPHNGQPVGAIGMIDTHQGKNDLAAVTNFTPEYPIEMDQGLVTGPCDPWPLSEQDVLIANNAIGAHGIIELVSRDGCRELVHCDEAISCYAPMPVKPRERPPVVGRQVEPKQPGRFLVADVYQGLPGVPRGTIKRLRVIEETARTSGLPPGGRWWNQAFLVSWQGAYIVKNILGVVPVREDGSAHFEAPPGKALYFEALDEEGREIQRMRTFVQAAPGVTRSCIGCHESKKSSPLDSAKPPLAALGPPAKIQPESWGSGYIDYPTMVQPVLDKYCVRCHGGPEGIGKGLDFSGGWTWAFNLSYETLIKNRLTGFLNCENGTVHTSRILPPRTIGSGAAPLAEILIKRHPEMSRAERDLVLAWMDTNSNYYGTWDYTPQATCDAILAVRGPLAAVMQQAGCGECHTPGFIGSDWVNLQRPEWSRILRAPMPKAKGSLGLAMCRKRKARNGYPLVDQGVQPPDVFFPSRQPAWDPSGEVHVSIATTSDPNYQAMLKTIEHARAEALARPRVDMPGAEVVPGECRRMVSMAVPHDSPPLAARLRPDSAVELSWPRTAQTIGLQYELHRGLAERFVPDAKSQVGLTTAGRFLDLVPPVGPQHYALVVTSGSDRSAPAWTTIDVPKPVPPQPPPRIAARGLPGEIVLVWDGPDSLGLRYDVYRKAGGGAFAKLNKEPMPQLSYSDLAVEAGTQYAYAVRAIDRRGQESAMSATSEASPLAEIKEPVFTVLFDPQGPRAKLLDGRTVKGTLHAGAKIADGALVLGRTGHCTFPHMAEFDLTRPLSLELWLWIDKEAPMPVIAACGGFMDHGWFLQRYGGGWRWHLAPASCDGGRPAVGRWVHLAAVYTGQKALLYEDGRLVAETDCFPNRAPWPGPLVLGQYSSPGESYQVQGKLKAVQLYRRALRAAEIAQHARSGPG